MIILRVLLRLVLNMAGTCASFMASPFVAYWRLTRSEPLDRPRTIRFASSLLLDAMFYFWMTPHWFSTNLQHPEQFYAVVAPIFGPFLLIKLLCFPLWCFPENGERAPGEQVLFMFGWASMIGLWMAVISPLNTIPLAFMLLVILVNNDVHRRAFSPLARHFQKLVHEEEQRPRKVRPLDF